MFGANDNEATVKAGLVLEAACTEGGRSHGQRRSLHQEVPAKKTRDWVGLPIMRSLDESDEAEDLNEVYRETNPDHPTARSSSTPGCGFTDESGR